MTLFVGNLHCAAPLQSYIFLAWYASFPCGIRELCTQALFVGHLHFAAPLQVYILFPIWDSCAVHAGAVCRTSAFCSPITSLYFFAWYAHLLFGARVLCTDAVCMASAFCSPITNFRFFWHGMPSSHLGSVRFAQSLFVGHLHCAVPLQI